MSLIEAPPQRKIAVPLKHVITQELTAVVERSSQLQKYECRHWGATEATLHFLESQVLFIRRQEGLCPECVLQRIRKNTIRCCYCGRPIFLGSRILRYSPNQQHLRNVQSFASSDAEGYAIGCLGTDCAGRLAGLEWFHWFGEFLMEQR